MACGSTVPDASSAPRSGSFWFGFVVHSIAAERLLCLVEWNGNRKLSSNNGSVVPWRFASDQINAGEWRYV